MTIEDLISRMEVGGAYQMGACSICGQETFSVVRIPRRDGRHGVETIYLCFREHRNETGLRMALEKGVEIDAK